MGAEDEAQVKVVSRLQIDVSMAQKSLQELGAQTKQLDNTLSKLEKKQLVDQFGKPLQTAAEAAQRMNGHMHGMQLSAAQVASKMKDMLPSMEAQLASVQARLRTEGLAKNELAAQAVKMREQVKLLEQQAAANGKLTNAESKQTQELQRQVSLLKEQARTTIADQKTAGMSMGEQLASQAQRRIGWFVSGALVMGTANELKQTLDDVSSLEMAFTELRRVAGDANMGEIQQSLFALAQQYGFDVQQVAKIAYEWVSAGYSIRDSVEATKQSLLALNSAQLSNEEATNSLVGVLRQWGLTVQDLPNVLDAINRVSDKYSIQANDLIDGLLRTSGAAKNANISLSETIALLTSMKEATGRSGGNVGNALNSILNFFQRDKALATVQESGIAVWADASQKKLRPLYDVITEIANNWNSLSDTVKDNLADQAQQAGLFSEEMAQAVGQEETWNDLQKRDLLTAGANSQRRNYLLGLISNFSQVQAVLNDQESVSGYTMQKNTVTMQAYEKRVAALKAELQQTAYQFASDSGILSGLKSMADGLKAGADWWNKLDGSTRNALVAMSLISGVLVAVNAALTHMAGVSLAGAIAKLITYTSSVGIATAASTAFNAVTSAVFSPTGLLIMGITALGGIWAYTASQAKEAAEAMKNAGAQADQIQQLRDKYMELAANTSRTKEEEAALQDVSKQLVDLLPQLATKFDDNGKAILNMGEVADQTTKRMAELRSETKLMLEEQAAIGKTELPGLESQLQKIEGVYGDFSKAVQGGPESLRSYMMGKWSSQMGGFAPNEAILSDEKLMADAGQQLLKMRAQVDDLVKRINAYKSAIAAVRPPIEQPLSDNDNSLHSGGGGSSSGGGGATTAGVKAATAAIIDQVQALQTLGEQTDASIAGLKARLDYESREKATAQELAQADRDRANMIELLSKRQDELHATAEAARAAITSLRAAQGQLNRSTSEGNSEWETLEDKINGLMKLAGTQANPIGALSEEWYKLQEQKLDLMRADTAATILASRQMKQLKADYDAGRISLEAYTAALEKLKKTNGEVSGLNDALSSALKDQWAKDVEKAWTDALDKVDAKLAKVKDDLKHDTDLIDHALKTFDASGTAYDYGTTKAKVSSAMSKVTGTYSNSGLFPDISQIKGIADTVKSLAFKDLGALTPDKFAEAMQTDLSHLRMTSNTAHDLLTWVGNAAEEQLTDIQGQLDTIDAWAEQRTSELQAQLNALDAQDQQDQREKATKEHNDKLKQLQDERTWTTLQGEADMQFKLAKIDVDIANEQRGWADQQAQWSKDDKKSSLQAQIDAVKTEADKRKKALEDERKDVEKRQKTYEDALNAILELIAAEVDQRKTATEQFKQQLTDDATAKETDLNSTKTWLQETQKAFGTTWAGILADATANGSTTGQSYVNALVSSLNGGVGQVQGAIDNINRAIGGSGMTPVPSGPLQGGGGLIRRMADGAYVRGGMGGVLAMVGEGKDDEVVFSRQHAIPMLTEALQQALTVSPMLNINAAIGAEFTRAVYEVAAAFPDRIEANFTLPDGTIQTQIIKFFAPFKQATRGI